MRLQNIAVPEDVHSNLKAAAARSRVSIRQFIEPTLRKLGEGEVAVVSDLWQKGEPAKDGRSVVIIGTIIRTDEFTVESLPECCSAYWDKESQQWLFTDGGLAICGCYGDKLTIHYWAELPIEPATSEEAAR